MSLDLHHVHVFAVNIDAAVEWWCQHIVSVQGGTRDQRWASSEKLWKWVDAHGKEFGIGRPYLGRDPPHVAPVDGQEYAAHNRGSKHAGSEVKKVKRAAIRDDPSLAKHPRAAAASKMRTS